jgi:putative restriction endonuclease
MLGRSLHVLNGPQRVGGPTNVNNWLVPSRLNHALFDRGALTVLDDFTILTSKLLHGDFGDNLVDRLKGKRINTPDSDSDYPEASYLQWHRKQVFHDVT